MKIIDLLNKIANGNIPKKIRFLNHYYIWKENDEDYQKEDGLMLFGNGKINYILNTEVEIIEEKKIPEKIKSNGKEFYCDNIDSWIDKEKTSAYCEYLMNKYNDLIDYLESKEKGE